MTEFKDKPLFSIVIPTYNRADRLKKALESLVAQTYKNFEVIVCDDGSTDNTGEVINSFTDKLTINYIWEENWGGPARPRNNGIKASKGDWICFLDSDDFCYPEKLEICSNHIDGFNFIYHDLDIYSDKDQVSIRKVGSRKLKGDVFIDLLVNGNAINNSSVVIKKELLLKVNGFSEERELIFIEDYDCWLRIFRIDNKYYYIPKSLGGYWIGNNASDAYERVINANKFVLNKYLNLLGKEERILANFNLNYKLGKLYYKMRKSDNAITCFKKAFTKKSLGRKARCFTFIIICYIRMWIK
jgi:glycosyltransferase involved in cell wall biosynthesis